MSSSSDRLVGRSSAVAVAPGGFVTMLAGVVCLTGCVTQPKWKQLPRRVTSTVFDEHGRKVKQDGTAPASYRILGLGPRRGDPLVEPQDKQDQELTPQEKRRRHEADIRNQFGPTVLIRGDLVTKRYFMSGETGAMFQQLVALPKDKGNLAVGGKADQASILGAMLGDHEVQIAYFKGFEKVPKLMVSSPGWKGGPLAPAGVKGAKGAPVAESVNDLLLVTAKPSNLAAFEDTLNLFFANIPQIEIEVKVVEFSTSDSLAFGTGGEKVTGGTPAGVFDNLSSSKLVSKITSSFPLSPPLGSGLDARGLIKLGGIHDGWELDATLQALQTQGRADILSTPRLVVRNGGTAAIATFTEFPFPRAKFSGVNVTSTDVSFRPVGITLGIKPVIAGTKTVILQIHADVSAVTGFADTDPVSTPIVSSRRAFTSVHVPDGKTTIIGGLHLRTTLEVETKIPILGDIPLLGYLFRSTSIQRTETNLEFFITPRIKIGTQAILSR